MGDGSKVDWKFLCRKVLLGAVFGISILGFWAFVFAGKPLSEGDSRVGKDPAPGAPVGGTQLLIPQEAMRNAECVKKCVYRHQMQAVALWMIEEQCREECDLEEAIRLSRSRLPEERRRGVQRLCRSKSEKAVPVLVDLLTKDLEERSGLWAWIIPALGRMGDRRAVPVLIKALQTRDDSWLGREMSARALGDLGDPSAVPALMDAAGKADTRAAAVEALARLKDERAIPVLLSALDPAEEPITRRAAVEGLKDLGDRAVPVLIEAFSRFNPEYPDTQTRILLCRLLGESGNDRALRTLRNALRDPDGEVRKCAAEYVGAM